MAALSPSYKEFDHRARFQCFDRGGHCERFQQLDHSDPALGRSCGKKHQTIGRRGNSDGIDIVNSRKVDVDGCYLRTMDDLVVIKTGDKKDGESSDIAVKTVCYGTKSHMP